MWLVLYRDTNPDGLVRTSQADLARRVGLTVRTVYAALKRLERCGLLVLVHRGGLNRGTSVYRLGAVADDDAQRKPVSG